MILEIAALDGWPIVGCNSFLKNLNKQVIIERGKRRDVAPAQPRLRAAALGWLVAGLCVAGILTLGSPLFSYTRTGWIIVPILHAAMPGANSGELASWHVFIRWSTHFLEYSALFLALSFGPLRGRPLMAFGVCLAIASLDESLQLMTATRSGKISDVALDMSGPATMLALALPYWESCAWRRRARALGEFARR